MRAAPARSGQRSTPRPAGRILTPDRRLRIFISSTLQELAKERSAVRSAVESLRLTPVLFELGARPHPPAALYRAYLQQCEVFVGIYWQSGGWVAPGSKLSGIEDEYNRARRLPRLIYVKVPAPGRDARLSAMLERIRSDADASYREFGSPEELRALVADDLAVLVSERFQLAVAPAGHTAAAERRSAGNLPVPPAPLIDRADELALLDSLLREEKIRLTTLTGPGGVGKTRLAIEAARAVSDRFAGGAWLVPLAPVRDPELVPTAILDALNLPAAGSRPAAEALRLRLRPQPHLLVLDNFEQAMAAAPFVADLVAAVPRLKVLVTTRVALRLRAEHEVPVSPLRVPSDRATAAEEMAAPAVQLFADRARAARPAFRLDGSNASAVAAITRRLDGLPLAIELAAARSRLLSPAELLAKLGDTLDLGAGLRDLPDRQRTLRSAMRWSFDLLDEPQLEAMLRLAVFRGGFTAEAASMVCRPDGQRDFLDVLAGLVDSSLVQRGGQEESRYTMLEVVREYALEKLAEAGLEAEARALHARCFAGLVETVAPCVFGRDQRRSLRLLDRDHDNITAAMEWHLDSGNVENLSALIWQLWPYWWFFGRLEMGRRRARLALTAGTGSELATARLAGAAGILAVWLADMDAATPLLETALRLFRQLDDSDATATVLTLEALATWPLDPARAVDLIAQCGPMFRAAGNRWGVALCANLKSWLTPELDADGKPAPHAREALALAEESGDDMNLGMALNNLGAQELQLGDLPSARAHIGRGLGLLAGLGARYVVSYIFELVVRIAWLSGDPATGAKLLGAAESIRAWLQVSVHPAQMERRERVVAALREQLGEPEFDRLVSLGRALDFEAAVSLATAACAADAEAVQAT